MVPSSESRQKATKFNETILKVACVVFTKRLVLCILFHHSQFELNVLYSCEFFLTTFCKSKTVSAKKSVEKQLRFP